MSGATPENLVPPPIVGIPPAQHEVQRIEVLLDGDGAILDDVACRRCGYNLHGLRIDGRCPECETSVGRSIHGDLLRLCDPQWVGRLATGALWIIIGVLGAIGASLFAGIVSAGIQAASGPISHDLVKALTVAIGFPFSAATVVGIWLLTTRDSGQTQSKAVTTRIIARYCLMAGIVTAPLQALWDPTGGLGASRNAFAFGGFFILLAVLALCLMIAQMIGYWRSSRTRASLRCASHTRRWPNRRRSSSGATL